MEYDRNGGEIINIFETKGSGVHDIIWESGVYDIVWGQGYML